MERELLITNQILFLVYSSIPQVFFCPGFGREGKHAFVDSFDLEVVALLVGVLQETFLQWDLVLEFERSILVEPLPPLIENKMNSARPNI